MVTWKLTPSKSIGLPQRICLQWEHNCEIHSHFSFRNLIWVKAHLLVLFQPTQMYFPPAAAAGEITAGTLWNRLRTNYYSFLKTQLSITTPSSIFTNPLPLTLWHSSRKQALPSLEKCQPKGPFQSSVYSTWRREHNVIFPLITNLWCCHYW